MRQDTVWNEVEWRFAAAVAPVDAYVAVTASATFRHDDGEEVARPLFWDGDATWGLRFAAPRPGRWSFTVRSHPPLPGLDGATGALEAAAAGTPPAPWQRHGLLRMAPGGRTVVHADGTPWFMVADTPWALPWRATPEQARRYAGVRQAQGFNAALLMSFLPDRSAPPAVARGAGGCWDEAFADWVAEGTLRRPLPGYFRAVDALSATLAAHGIAAVWNPLFHGYGFRGGPQSGIVAGMADAARYARYLVARYGARPALWLVGADGQGDEPTVAAMGEAVEAADAYRQPCGIHYAPHAPGGRHQAAPWLDFQWCQTGHNGEHRPEALTRMWAAQPVRAIANGEPTYEEIGRRGRAAGWWQGDEAWRNLCAGSTMGVVYGAAALWQWKQARDEPHQPWADAAGCDWADALAFPGAAVVGQVGRILAGLDLAGAAPDWCGTHGRAALFAPGRVFVTYLHEGGGVALLDPRIPRRWRAHDCRSGAVVAAGELAGPPPAHVELPAGQPLVLVAAA